MNEERTQGLRRREFLGWLCKIGGGATALTLGPGMLPLRRVNTTLFRGTAHADGQCGEDVCTTRDICESGDAGHTCQVQDVCDVDESGDCTGDRCATDTSGACTNDGGGRDEDECPEDYTTLCSNDSSGACNKDGCIADSSGECQSDLCTADSSADCTSDRCTADSSGQCNNDGGRPDEDECPEDYSRRCVSDSSGACTNDGCTADYSQNCTQSDICTADSSGACATDKCTADSSGECSQSDTCTADSSGECSQSDTCIADTSGNCAQSDTCTADYSGACATDKCYSDESGDCTNRDSCQSDYSGNCILDVCVLDASLLCSSDLCREDRSPSDCTTKDTCALDLSFNSQVNRRSFARTMINQAIKTLYHMVAIILFLAVGYGQSKAATVIDATDAVFSDTPAYVTDGSVSVPSPVGPFLRDCDGDGILEADTNGDGLCAGDPEVRDYNADGSRELPEGTTFAGDFRFTCFYVPDDVAITATGPLTIAASREAAVFGAVRLASGIGLSCPAMIDLRTSAWLSEDGSAIGFTTGLTGGIDETQNAYQVEDTIPAIEFTSLCSDAPTATPIPALSEWGMILFMVLLGGITLRRLRRRQTA